jgi:hypothetical protein
MSTHKETAGGIEGVAFEGQPRPFLDHFLSYPMEYRQWPFFMCNMLTMQSSISFVSLKTAEVEEEAEPVTMGLLSYLKVKSRIPMKIES